MFCQLFWWGPFLSAVEKGFQCWGAVRVAAGEDPRESKFLEGLFLAKLLLVLPDCRFSQPVLPCLCRRSLKGNISSGIKSRAEW